MKYVLVSIFIRPYSPRHHYDHSFVATWGRPISTPVPKWDGCQIGVSCMTPSSSTGCPVLEVSVLQNHFEPSSRTGRPKLARCPFGDMMVPVSALGWCQFRAQHIQPDDHLSWFLSSASLFRVGSMMLCNDWIRLNPIRRHMVLYLLMTLFSLEEVAGASSFWSVNNLHYRYPVQFLHVIKVLEEQINSIFSKWKSYMSWILFSQWIIQRMSEQYHNHK